MAGEAVFDYTALRGITALGTEVLATLEDNTAETLGAAVSELVTNGDFPTDTSSWTAGNSATLSIDTARLKVLNSAASAGYAYQTVNTVVGLIYKYTLTYTKVTTTMFMRIGDSAGTGNGQTLSSSGTYTIYFKATATTTYIKLQCQSSVINQYILVDDVSLKISNNLVENGSYYVSDFWTLATGWTISGGVASHTPGNALAINQTSVAFTALKDYVVTFTVSNTTVGTIRPQFTGTTTLNGTDRSANGTYTETLTALTGNNDFRFSPSSAFDGDIDNVSVYPAVPDSSTNEDGLEIHGEIIKSVVNTGSGLVAYSNFSEDNYLKQPYSSNLDFGTGSFSVLFWIKKTSATSAVVFDRDSATSAQRYKSSIASTLTVTIDDDTTQRTVTSTSAFDDSEWHLASIVYDSSNGDIKIYKDAILDKTDSGSILLTLSNSSAYLTVGQSILGSSPLSNGSVALFKIDSGLTQTQITTIYNNEKGLFKRYAPFQIIGENYSLQTIASVKSPSFKVNKNRSIALDGISIESVIKHDSQFFKVSTDLIRFDEIQPWREMLFSLKGDETFTFTPGGGYEPNEDIVCSIENIARDEIRQNDSIFFRYDLELRVRE